MKVPDHRIKEKKKRLWHNVLISFSSSHSEAIFPLRGRLTVCSDIVGCQNWGKV